MKRFASSLIETNALPLKSLASAWGDFKHKPSSGGAMDDEEEFLRGSRAKAADSAGVKPSANPCSRLSQLCSVVRGLVNSSQS